jgi:hypothetical protein
LDTSDPVTSLNAALEGRYRIEREVGEGGMATVYLAKDLKHIPFPNVRHVWVPLVSVGRRQHESSL